MNRYIPDEIIDEIKGRSDIVELINSYLPLKRTGSNFKANCPFHQEKTPSFIVNPQRQSYHCFGCGKGGNIFTFIMEKEGIDFPNAVHILAQKLNITIPEKSYSGSPEDRRKSVEKANLRERLYQLHEDVCSWYQQRLKNKNDPVSWYLTQRQIPESTIQKFRLGASPDSWSDTIDYLKNKGYSESDLITGGIAKESDSNSTHIYDRFRNRLMFPIWNEQGKVVAFSARTIENNPSGGKYINSPETPIFKKSNILYALPLARKKIQEEKYVIVSEGQLDVIALHRAEFSNSVAPQGTAFTPEQGRILKRYANRLFLAFDADGAGINAAKKALEITLRQGFEVRIMQFPENLDPDEIFKNQGAPGIKSIVDSACDFFDFLIKCHNQNQPDGSPWELEKIISEVLKYLALIDSSVIRSSYASQLAGKFNLPENTIFTELNKIRKTRKFNPGINQTVAPTPEPPAPSSVIPTINERIGKAEAILLEMSLAHGTVGKRLSEELPSEFISNTNVGKALEKVIQMTLVGEWENSGEELLKNLTENPDNTISRILTSPVEYDHEHQEKAVSDCLKVIKSYYLQKDIDNLINSLKNATDEEIKKQIRNKYLQKRAELNKVRKQ